MNVIEAENLDFCYGRHKAIDKISLTVEKGRFYALLGPNGSGKSTLLRLLSGVEKAGKDNILLYGKRFNEYTIKERARLISFVPQSQEIDFPFSCFEIIMMGRFAYQGLSGFGIKEDEKIVRQCMEFTKTENLAERLITQLSGGEVQRVLLAQALAQESEILILDEPTSHLDIKFQLEMMNLLKRLNKEKGITIITSLHDLNLASGNSDYLFFMEGGKIRESGSAREILTEDIIKRIFNVDARIIKNPINNCPLVIFGENGDKPL